MTVEQTTEWVRTLGRYHGWKEADTYAKNFKTNNKRLFPQSDLSKNLPWKKPVREEELTSPMSESKTETEQVEAIACSLQRSPCKRSMMGYLPNSPKVNLKQGEHTNEITECSEGPTKCTTAVNHTSSTNLPANSVSWSSRASPANPLVYRTLSKVRLRSGKSLRSKDIGYLPAKALVLINQIKGRSGRVVFREEDGSFVNKGWVILFSEDKRHLLKRYNRRRKMLDVLFHFP